MSKEPNQNNEPIVDENSIISERRSKLEELRKLGIAFPSQFKPENLSSDLHKNYDEDDKETLEKKSIEVSVSGRMMLKRVMGKASFATIQDNNGRIQLYVARDFINSDANPELYAQFKKWDLGDIIGAKGKLFKTRTNELTVEVTEIILLTKSIRPLPEKFHGLSDQETKYRQRYVDLIVNEDTKKTFLNRSKIISNMRAFMEGHEFLEVETPMLHPIPGPRLLNSSLVLSCFSYAQLRKMLTRSLTYLTRCGRCCQMNIERYSQGLKTSWPFLTKLFKFPGPYFLIGTNFSRRFRIK